ncbi:MAG: hypothetical protein Q8Q42_02680 [Nanoarchaeota archaeon]|nr:hypothetical protein [Nanoarchaeota archaeon]
MDLNQLTEFMLQKRNEFEKAVSDKAKKLKLQDIIKEIQLVSEHATIQKNIQKFKNGQTLNFRLYRWYYSVAVNQQELILRGNYGIEVAKFRGDEVKRFYESLSTAILTEAEEELKNWPF